MYIRLSTDLWVKDFDDALEADPSEYTDAPGTKFIEETGERVDFDYGFVWSRVAYLPCPARSSTDDMLIALWSLEFPQDGPHRGIMDALPIAREMLDSEPEAFTRQLVRLFAHDLHSIAAYGGEPDEVLLAAWLIHQKRLPARSSRGGPTRRRLRV